MDTITVKDKIGNGEKIGLFIETSSESGLVAAASKSKVFFKRELHSGLHSSSLMPSIQKGFDETSLEPEDISYVSVGIGPGSYTGIRIGVAVAKTFSFARALPLIGFSSLLGFLPEEDGCFASIMDAKIGGLYLVKGKKEGKEIEYLSEPKLVPLDSFLDEIGDIRMVVTPCKMALEKKLLGSAIPAGNRLKPPTKSVKAFSPLQVRGERQLPRHAAVGSESSEGIAILGFALQEKFPNLEHIRDISLKKYNNKEFSLDCYLDLIYLRKTQAEIEKGG